MSMGVFMNESLTAQNGHQAKDHTVDASREVDPLEEIFHMQADGFWGLEKGFQDAEQLRNQRQ
jgi:hypothetical protein